MRRLISSHISTDPAINKLALESDFAALLYTWLVAHTNDSGVVEGTPEEIRMKVIPGRTDKTDQDVAAALSLISRIKDVDRHPLITWDRNGHRVIFPESSFYKHQSYIPYEDRRTKRTDNIPSEAELDKTGAVIKLLPSSNENSRAIIRLAIRKFPQISKEDCVLAMLTVLEKHHGDQHATWFARQLEWKAQGGRTMFDSALSPDEYKSLYKQEQEEAKRMAEQTRKELESNLDK